MRDITKKKKKPKIMKQSYHDGPGNVIPPASELKLVKNIEVNDLVTLTWKGDGQRNWMRKIKRNNA